jgi:hypothetical protein
LFSLYNLDSFDWDDDEEENIKIFYPKIPSINNNNIFIPSMDKLTKKDIINVINYLINNCYYKKNIKNEMKYIYESFIEVFNRLSIYLNKFIVANIIILMERLYNIYKDDNYFNFNNIITYFVVCFIIINKYYTDGGNIVKEILNIFSYNNMFILDVMFEILNLLNLDVHTSDKEIEKIYNKVF